MPAHDHDNYLLANNSQYFLCIFYKAVNNLVFIHSEALPVTRQPMSYARLSSSSVITYISKRSRTITHFSYARGTHGTPTVTG